MQPGARNEGPRSSDGRATRQIDAAPRRLVNSFVIAACKGAFLYLILLVTEYHTGPVGGQPPIRPTGLFGGLVSLAASAAEHSLQNKEVLSLCLMVIMFTVVYASYGFFSPQTAEQTKNYKILTRTDGASPPKVYLDPRVARGVALWRVEHLEDES
jgi:hypothetical protein